MAGSQIERFERWRGRQTGHLAHLVQLVLNEVVPELEAAGLRRHADYAANLSRSVSATTIALQRRSGPLWPTVEIEFPLRRKPLLGLTFAMLPETCYRYGEAGPEAIPRLEANVVEGDIAFSLCKGGNRNYDCNFGYEWLALLPARRLRAEVDQMKQRLPWLLDVLNSGIPADWLTLPRAGRAGQYARVSVRGSRLESR
ncbi:hypothetical protein [Pseudoduganella violacea]|uniref:Uncharacterized protein n=1 Tax=Pseudoduganella violacea TaxID=1715466 RepID=A0A7W5B8L7_9BURK|nr:hypothetical protein [Pseudoduganella violacea]MBB3118225.1 hypothetical protein [Pseudoduganella violacea]